MARINQVVSRNEGLGTLSEALIAAKLDEALSEGGPYTFFAPNEDAFSELGSDALIALATDSTDLARLLRSHMVAGRFTLRDLGGLERLESVEGTDLYLSFGPEGDSYVEDARIVEGDIVADNGVVHVIDLVILPLPDETAMDGSRNATGERGPLDLLANGAFDSSCFFDYDAENNDESEPVAV